MFLRKSLWILILLLTLLIYPSFALSTAAQGVCGDTYTVLPGDTLSEIAELCGTTVAAILAANPQITDPTRIFVGQTLRIPRSQDEPVLAISVECGPIGTELLVLGSGYPPNSTVEIRLFQKDRPVLIAGRVVSDAVGWIDTEVTIPSSAVSGTPFYIIAEARIGDTSFTGTSNAFSVIAPAADPNAATTYVVQPGDTPRSIAFKFNRSLDAIFEANPQITDPTQLQTGQRLTIPAQAIGASEIGLTPVCGPPEIAVQVTGEGFPAGATVDIMTGRYLADYTSLSIQVVNSNQAFTTSLVIPITALPGQYWVVTGETTRSPKVRAISNLFTVTQPRDPNGSLIYIVKPEDTLNEIAAIYQRSVSSILSANPQIDNPNRLNAEEKLIIPRIEEVIAISPLSGPPGTILQVGGRGFPANAKVEIGLGRKKTNYALLETAITDRHGLFLTQAAIPGSARPGERWVVVGTLARVEEPRITAISEEFIVTKPAESLKPVVTIWPLSGPVSSDLNIVASGFPPYTPIEISLWKQGVEFALIKSTWTDINGTCAAETIIPASTSAGETLVIVIKTITGPALEVSSPLFTITETGSP